MKKVLVDEDKYINDATIEYCNRIKVDCRAYVVNVLINRVHLAAAAWFTLTFLFICI